MSWFRYNDLLARERQSGRADEFTVTSLGYRAEVERLQREVLDYLTRPSGTASRSQPDFKRLNLTEE